MRTISDTLKAAAQSEELFPLSKVTCRRVKMGLPASFAGAETGSNYYLFDFTRLSDGRYLRVRVEDTEEAVVRQIISDPTNPSQWTTWTGVTGLGNVIWSAGIALWASSTDGRVELYYFRTVDASVRLSRSVSLDYGVTWGSPEDIYTFPAAQGGYRCTAPDQGVVFFNREYDTDWDLSEIVCAWWDGVSWQTSASGYRYGWKFFADFFGNTLTSVKLDDGRILLIASPSRWEEASCIYSSQAYRFTYSRDGLWSPVQSILPLDVLYDVAGANELHGRARLSRVGNKYLCHLESRRVYDSTCTTGFGHYWYIWSRDGENWCTDGSDVIPSAAAANSGKDCFVHEDYFYEVGWGKVWRAEATYLLGYDDPTDLSEDVPSWEVSIPSGTEATLSTIDVKNTAGKYNNHEVVAENAQVRVEAGYKTSAGDELTTLFTGYVDNLNTASDRLRNVLTLQCRDSVKRLKQKASNATVYLSQSRYYNTFGAEGDDQRFLTNIGDYSLWELDTVNGRLKATTAGQRNWALAGMDKLEDFWVKTTLRWTVGMSWAGLALCMQEVDCQDGYTVVYDTVNKLKLERHDDGVVTQLALGQSRVWSTDTDYDILVIRRFGKFYVYVKTGATTWGLDFSYTDTKYAKGYCGLYAIPATNGTVEYSEFWARSFNTDWSVEDIIKDAGTRCGVEDFNIEAELYDSFSGATLDPNNWSETGKEGSFDIVDETLQCLAGATGWYALRSNFEARNIKITYKMKIGSSSEASGRGGVMLRAASLASDDYYLLHLEIDPEGDKWIYFSKSETGVGKVQVVKFPLPDYAGLVPNVWYNFAVSHQDDWLSLWCDEVLLFTWYEETYPDSGYYGLHGTNSVHATYYDDVRVSELDLVVPLWAINASDVFEDTVKTLVGEVAGFYTFDGDGVLKAWVTEPTEAYFTFQSPVKTAKKTLSDLEWASAVRVDGDYCWGNAFDEDLINERGWRFQFYEMKELGTAKACTEAAEAKLTELKARLNLRDFEAPIQVALEKGDLVHYINAKDGTDADFLVEQLRFWHQKRPVEFKMAVSVEG